MKHYWYTMALAGSLIIAGAVLLPPGSSVLPPAAEQTAASESGENGGADLEADAAPGKDAVPGTDAAAPGDAVASGSTVASGDAAAPGGTVTSGDAADHITPSEAPGAGAEPSQENASPTSFSGSLFIGDSRTVGLGEYGGLDGAEVFANTGMSCFNLLSAEETTSDGSKKTLEQLLAEKQFSTIYLMLGINEMGYPNDSIVKQYTKIVNLIKTAQPNAYLILEANLHVTQAKSDSNPTYGNDRINALNGEIFQIAAANGCGYLDINSLFDDAGGALNPQYSTDGAHVLGKYYRQWAQWLLEQKA